MFTRKRATPGIEYERSIWRSISRRFCCSVFRMRYRSWRVSSGDSAGKFSIRWRCPLTRIAGCEPTVRWRSDAFRPTIHSSRVSIEYVVSGMAPSIGAIGSADRFLKGRVVQGGNPHRYEPRGRSTAPFEVAPVGPDLERRGLRRGTGGDLDVGVTAAVQRDRPGRPTGDFKAHDPGQPARRQRETDAEDASALLAPDPVADDRGGPAVRIQALRERPKARFPREPPHREARPGPPHNRPCEPGRTAVVVHHERAGRADAEPATSLYTRARGGIVVLFLGPETDRPAEFAVPGFEVPARVRLRPGQREVVGGAEPAVVQPVGRRRGEGRERPRRHRVIRLVRGDTDDGQQDDCRRGHAGPHPVRYSQPGHDEASQE